MPGFGELVRTVRSRVVAAYHSGHVHAGERLASVRDLAVELGEDPRTILRAYRVLEKEGLVEIRTRSGVYLASQEKAMPEIVWETSRWVVDEVLTQAWHRRIALPDLPDFIRRCTSAITVRCACVDAVEDARIALCREIREDFGMETIPIPMTAAPEDSDPHRLSSLRQALRRADLIVTTSFHATEVRPVAEALSKPLIVMTMNPIAREEIERLRRKGSLTFVVLDPGLEERLRLIFGDDLRVVLAHDREALEQIGDREKVILSRAAAERLRDPPVPVEGDLKTPLISPETARELSQWLVHLHLQALRSAGADEP